MSEQYAGAGELRLSEPNCEGWWWGRTIIDGEAQKWQVSQVELRDGVLCFQNETDGYDDPLPIENLAGEGWYSEWVGPIPEPRKIVPCNLKGGKWLGAAREWIQWNVVGGDSVTWGSNEILRTDFTPKMIEDLAAHVAAAAVNEERESCYRAGGRD